MTVIILSSLLIGIYSVIMLNCTVGWLKLAQVVNMKTTPTTNVTVIVPLRNEIKNVRRILKQLAAQQYPLSQLQLILVDDHSSDGTNGLLKKIGATYSNMLITQLDHGEGNGKKAAIKKGLNLATGQLIITLDADCHIKTDHIRSFSNYFEQTNAHMLIGPVQIRGIKKFTHIWEALELIGLSGIAGAATHWNNPILANGANFGFSQEVIKEIGYESYDSLASGDDMFLLHHFKKHGKKIVYIKDTSAIAVVKPQLDFNQLIQQRLRWSSKNMNYSDRTTMLVGSLVFLTNSYLLFSGIYCLFKAEYLPIFLAHFVIKCIIDFLFLFLVSSFFKKMELMYWFLPIQVINILYVVIISIVGTSKPYTWKGREYSK